MPTDFSQPPCGEFAVSRLGLVSVRGNTSSGASIQAVRLSAQRIVPMTPGIGNGAASTKPFPGALLVRAWRNVVELRIDDAFAAVVKFQVEAGDGRATAGTNAREFADVLTAVLSVLKSDDIATVR